MRIWDPGSGMEKSWIHCLQAFLSVDEQVAFTKSRHLANYTDSHREIMNELNLSLSRI
jgi:hypothetical protein